MVGTTNQSHSKGTWGKKGMERNTGGNKQWRKECGEGGGARKFVITGNKMFERTEDHNFTLPQTGNK